MSETTHTKAREKQTETIGNGGRPCLRPTAEFKQGHRHLELVNALKKRVGTEIKPTISMWYVCTKRKMAAIGPEFSM